MKVARPFGRRESEKNFLTARELCIKYKEVICCMKKITTDEFFIGGSQKSYCRNERKSESDFESELGLAV